MLIALLQSRLHKSLIDWCGQSLLIASMLVLLASHIDQIWIHMPQRRAEQMSDYDMQRQNGLPFYPFVFIFRASESLWCSGIMYNYQNDLNKICYSLLLYKSNVLNCDVLMGKATTSFYNLFTHFQYSQDSTFSINSATWPFCNTTQSFMLTYRTCEILLDTYHTINITRVIVCTKFDCCVKL